MIFVSAGRRPWALLVAGLLLVSGCDAFFGGGDDSKNPLLAEARVRRDQYDYDGAVTLLKKALEANPRLYRAHWDLGVIFYQYKTNHAAAIYHFEELLSLKPDWKQAEQVRSFITASKIELAKQAPFGADTPEGQRLIFNMTAQLHQLDRANVDLRNKLTNSFAAFQQLAAENARLREQLQRATVVVPTSAPPPVPLRPPAVVSTNPAASGTASTSPAHGTSNPPSVATAPRTYTIQAGDRLAGIARRYRTTVDELQRLNPTLNVNRIKPNQVIRIP